MTDDYDDDDRSGCSRDAYTNIYREKQIQLYKHAHMHTYRYVQRKLRACVLTVVNLYADVRVRCM